MIKEMKKSLLAGKKKREINRILAWEKFLDILTIMEHVNVPQKMIAIK